MELKDAIEIVLALAAENVLNPVDAAENDIEDERQRQLTALDVVAEWCGA